MAKLMTSIIIVLDSSKYVRISQNWGVTFWVSPYYKDHSILGSILGSPSFGKLPYWARIYMFFYSLRIFVYPIGSSEVEF